MAYSLLSDLDSNRDDWIVRVRVCRMWEFINFKRSRELISLDLILMDEKENLMHAVIWKNQVNRFRDKFSEGSMIIIRNFKVTNSTGEYRPVASNFKITFLRITAVQKLQEDIVHIPINGFQFIQPDMIQSRVNNNTILLDVVGCLCGIGDIESVGSKWKKRDIQILTDYSVKSKITLWGDFGEKFYPYLYKTESGPYIIIITSTTAKEFRGEVSFATTAASKIYVNLKIDYITSLIQKFSTISVGVQTFESTSVKNVPIEEEMFQNRMNITDLLEFDGSADIQECIVTLRAKITEIDNYFDWYYISCNLCNKKIVPANGVYTCHTCTKECEFPLVRYKIHIQVKDKTGRTTLVLFNAVAEKLLDTSAFKLVNRLSSGDNDIPSQIKGLCGKEFVFKLKLNNFNLKEGLENFTVTKLFIPNEELELQYNLRNDKKGKTKVDDINEAKKQTAEGFIKEHAHAATSFDNLEDSQQDLHDSDGGKSWKRRTSSRKIRLLKNNQEPATTSLVNLENFQEDLHDCDGLNSWKRRTSTRKFRKRRSLFIDDDEFSDVATKKNKK